MDANAELCRDKGDIGDKGDIRNMKVAVVMCTFRRLDVLPRTLEMLKAQTDTHFDLYIWNNNENVRDLRPVFEGKDYPFRIESHASSHNVGGIGRFLQCREMVDAYPYVVFIDDDQSFDRYLIETFKREAEPGVISGWWAFKIWRSYNQRTRCRPGEEADYVGTGCMICPLDVFRNEALIRDIPQKYTFIEDLWLSYFAKYECGYALRMSAVKVGFIPNEDARNQHQKLARNKIEFHKYLEAKYKPKTDQKK